MADSERVGERKRGAELPSASPQPVAERAPSVAPEDGCDDDVARLQATIAALEAVIAARDATITEQAGELAMQRAALRAAAAHAEDVEALWAAVRRLGGTRSVVVSAASPALILAVLARLAENGYAADVVRCVSICKDARSNAQLWERIVDQLHADVDVRRSANYRTTRLIHWAREGDLARVRETLGRGAGVDARDTYGRTALDVAGAGGHLDVVRELLDRGAVVDAFSVDGMTAITGALICGHTDVVLELAARGADVNVRCTNGAAPLIVACHHGHVATAAELVRLGADINAVDNAGWSALMHAAYGGHIDAVRMLLAAPGVNFNLSDADGRTALSVARSNGRGAVVALLEAASAR